MEFSYIFWMFLKKKIYSSKIGGHVWGSGGKFVPRSFPLGTFNIFGEEMFFSEFEKFWAIQLVNIAFFEVKMSKYWQNWYIWEVTLGVTPRLGRGWGEGRGENDENFKCSLEPREQFPKIFWWYLTGFGEIFGSKKLAKNNFIFCSKLRRSEKCCYEEFLLQQKIAKEGIKN